MKKLFFSLGFEKIVCVKKYVIFLTLNIFTFPVSHFTCKTWNVPYHTFHVPCVSIHFLQVFYICSIWVAYSICFPCVFQVCFRCIPRDFFKCEAHVILRASSVNEFPCVFQRWRGGHCPVQSQCGKLCTGQYKQTEKSRHLVWKEITFQTPIKSERDWKQVNVAESFIMWLYVYMKEANILIGLISIE